VPPAVACTPAPGPKWKLACFLFSLSLETALRSTFSQGVAVSGLFSLFLCPREPTRASPTYAREAVLFFASLSHRYRPFPPSTRPINTTAHVPPLRRRHVFFLLLLPPPIGCSSAPKIRV
jgi:hypothetical protein